MLCYIFKQSDKFETETLRRVVLSKLQESRIYMILITPLSSMEMVALVKIFLREMKLIRYLFGGYLTNLPNGPSPIQPSGKTHVIGPNSDF